MAEGVGFEPTVNVKSICVVTTTRSEHTPWRHETGSGNVAGGRRVVPDDALDGCIKRAPV
jgi:hypothetical protein